MSSRTIDENLARTDDYRSEVAKNSRRSKIHEDLRGLEVVEDYPSDPEQSRRPEGFEKFR